MKSAAFWTCLRGVYIFSYRRNDSARHINRCSFSSYHKSNHLGDFCLKYLKKAISNFVDFFFFCVFASCVHTFCSRLISFCLVWRATKACSCSTCSCCFSSTASCICCWETESRRGRVHTEGCDLQVVIGNVPDDRPTITIFSPVGGNRFEIATLNAWTMVSKLRRGCNTLRAGYSPDHELQKKLNPIHQNERAGAAVPSDFWSSAKPRYDLLTVRSYLLIWLI